MNSMTKHSKDNRMLSMNEIGTVWRAKISLLFFRNFLSSFVAQRTSTVPNDFNIWNKVHIVIS